MDSINFQPCNKTMVEVVEYMENFEILGLLEFIHEQLGASKSEKDCSKD